MPISQTVLEQLITEAREHYAGLHKQIDANRKLRYGEHDIRIPEAYRNSTVETRTPILADILLRVTATLTTDEPVIKVPPYGTTDKAIRNSSQRERWSQGAKRQMEREARRPIFRMGLGDAVSDGVGVWKCNDRADVWQGLMARKPDEDAGKYLERVEKHKKGSPFPFVWQDIDPLNYYEMPAGYGEFQSLEISKRPAIATMERFGVWRDSNKSFKQGRTLGEPMPNDSNYSGQTWELTEHWSADGQWVTYYLDNEIVDQRNVHYPRPPYFRFGGHTTSSRDPKRAFQSVIQPFVHLIPTLDSILTMATNRLYQFAYPFMRRRESGKPVRQGPHNPLSFTDLEPGELLENVEFMGEIGPSAILAEMYDRIMQMIDRSGLAAVMYGQGASSSSGYMVSQLMTAAQLVYAPIVDNARMALEAMIPFMWMLIKRRNMGRVYVWGAGASSGQSDWLYLGPDDIGDYMACEVSLKPRLPLDKIAERQSLGQMVQGELLSRADALEELGYEQPEEKLDAVELDVWKRSPDVRGPMGRKLAEEAGLVEPPPPAPVGPPPGAMPPGPGLVDQFGNAMPPSNQGTMPTGLGITPTIPAVNAPLIPPPPQGAGMAGIPGGMPLNMGQ